MREWLSGRASPCQGERREFESRLPLHVGASVISLAPIFFLVPLGVDINPQFYWGKIKALAYENKTAYDIIVNGLATALLKYQGGFKQC